MAIQVYKLQTMGKYVVDITHSKGMNACTTLEWHSVELYLIHLQLVFLQEPTGHEPDVYRFLPRDVAIYRVFMGMAVVGSLTAVTYMYKMATGSVPAKRE